MNHIKLSTIQLKNHPELNERWLQDVIADEPSILGLGDVVLKDRERIQPRAGRLDLLLQDADGHGRYEVEIQLGAADESHIIRTIEYWDLERRRYPQYDHTAVIVAEDVTSRFLNVIGLFNGFIPIVALQLSAIQTNDGVGLHFTKVLDSMQLGLPEEDEPTNEQVDRAYWEITRDRKDTVLLYDKILTIINEFVPDAEPGYNKHYIGIVVNGRACNFVTCKPQKSALRLNFALPQSDEVDSLFEATDLDVLDYDKRWRRYGVKVKAEGIKQHHDTLLEVLRKAYEHRTRNI